MANLNFDDISAEDFTEALRCAGSLIKFHATAWSGSVSDFDALDTVRANAGAKGDIGSFRTRLLANNDAELKALQAAVRKARNYYYQHTAQWSPDPGSSRLIPNEKIIPFITEFHTYQQNVDEAKKAFVDSYPDARDKAIADLGSLAKPEMYPSAEEIADKFRMSFQIDPIPDSGGFRNMPPGVIDRLSLAQRQRTAARVRHAFSTSLSEVDAALSNAVERLADEEGKFKNTLLSNVTTPAATLRPFNITKDAEVAAAIDACEALSGYDLTDVRKNLSVRKAAHDDAVKAQELVRGLLSDLEG